MEEFIIIARIIFKVYLWCCFWNVLFFHRQLSQYHKIYETLKDRKFYLCREMDAVISTPLFEKDMIVWRYKKNSMALKIGIYLFNNPIYYINDPYSLYWHWRFKKWFKKNLDLSILEEKYF